MKKYLIKAYRWFFYNFIYNKTVEELFFKNGYEKSVNGQKMKMSFRYSWFYPEKYEIEKTRFIQSHCGPGDTVIDIGAHIGLFTFFLAKQVGPQGKVYSFEPTPLTFEVLQKNVRLNHLEQYVIAEQKAIARSDGELTFYLGKNTPICNGNSISSHNAPRKEYTVTHKGIIKVKTLSLDSLLNRENIDKLKFIKIDVEGAELEVLKGGKKLIEKFKPYMTLEVHPHSFDVENSVTELYNLIRLFGYKIYYDRKELTLEDFHSFESFFEVMLIPEKTYSN